MTSFIRNAFESGEFSRNMNETLIAFIPKTDTPETMGQFKHIALCNVVTKIITKVIANRIKTSMSELVHETPTSFIP